MRTILCGFLLGIFSLVLAASQNTFTNVDLLQRAAAPILSNVGWKNIGSGLGFYGSSEVRLPSTAFVPSTVSYSISGNTGNRVDQALVSAFIASPRDLTAGRAKFEAVVTQWFQSVGTPVPAGLLAAIKTGKRFQGAAGGLSIQYAVERGMGSTIKQPDGTSYRSTTMDLTIKPL